MIIYEPMVKPGFEWINIVNSRDYKLFFSLEGKPLGGTWKPIQVRRVPMDEKSEFVPSDFPWYGGWLIVRQGAAEKLKDIFEKNGELLPLMTDDDARLFVYNVQVVDSLDESNSDIQ